MIRERLVDLFKNLGMGHRFTRLVKEMFEGASYQVLLDGMISPSFLTNVGLKQGDNMSCKFFNVYVHDKPFLLQSIKDIPMLVDTLIPCLLFADDIVLLAKTKEALQKLVDKTV